MAWPRFSITPKEGWLIKPCIARAEVEIKARVRSLACMLTVCDLATEG
jgi:hypothetical protein